MPARSIGGPPLCPIGGNGGDAGCWPGGDCPGIACGGGPGGTPPPPGIPPGNGGGPGIGGGIPAPGPGGGGTGGGAPCPAGSGRIGRSFRTLTGPAAGSSSPKAFAWKRITASSRSGCRIEDMPSSGAEEAPPSARGSSSLRPRSLMARVRVSNHSRLESSSYWMPVSRSDAIRDSSPSSISFAMLRK